MQPGAPKTPNEQRKASLENRLKSPSIEQLYIRYGKISAVSKNGFVKVILLNDKGEPDGKEIVGGRFLPLNTQLDTLLLNFGQLRKGLICRVFWKGNNEPNANCTVDIIGDEDHRFLIKEPYPNEVTIGPFKIFAGGMLV